MVMAVIFFASLTQIKIWSHSAFESRAMEVTNTAPIASDATVAQSTIWSSRALIIAFPVIHDHHNPDWNLVGPVDL